MLFFFSDVPTQVYLYMYVYPIVQVEHGVGLTA